MEPSFPDVLETLILKVQLHVSFPFGTRGQTRLRHLPPLALRSDGGHMWRFRQNVLNGKRTWVGTGDE